MQIFLFLSHLPPLTAPVPEIRTALAEFTWCMIFPMGSQKSGGEGRCPPGDHTLPSLKAGEAVRTFGCQHVQSPLEVHPSCRVAFSQSSQVDPVSDLEEKNKMISYDIAINENNCRNLKMMESWGKEKHARSKQCAQFSAPLECPRGPRPPAATARAGTTFFQKCLDTFSKYGKHAHACRKY